MTIKYMSEEDGGLPYTVRAVFIVTRMDFHNPSSIGITFRPVYSEDPDHPNKTFWDTVTTGELTMTVNNQRTAKFFEVGQEYHLDFSHPPRAASVGIREAMRIEEMIQKGAGDPVPTVTNSSGGVQTFTSPNVTITT